MRVTLSLEKSIDENAAVYFERAKREKRKLGGARDALARTQKELASIAASQAEAKKSALAPVRRKTEWYERFRWFFSSEGILCVGGRDASSNEQLVKKHAHAEEMVVHCDIPGSPFFVIKAGDTQVGEQTLVETAVATASYSRGWRLGLGSIEAYAVKGSQLSKEAASGEYLTKGSFVVRGKRRTFTVIPRLAIAFKEGRVIAGPAAAVGQQAERVIEVVPGTTKTSSAAKEIRSLIGGGEIDDIVRALPAGGCKILKTEGGRR